MARFDAAEYGRRLARVRDVMAERSLSALVVTGPENVHYLSGLDCQGFFALSALVVPASGTPLLVTRAMEHPTVAAQVVGCVHLPYTDLEEPAVALARTVREVCGVGDDVGVCRDLAALPPAAWDELRAALTGRNVVDGSGIVESVRQTPSPDEVMYVKQAAVASSAAMRAGMAAVKEGATERDVAAEVYRAMILAGSEYPGFVPLVRSRTKLLQEHVTWGDERLDPGDALFLELSGCVARYHAPMTRMVYVDGMPPGTEEAARIAIAGREAVREALRPGVSAASVYEAWQRVVDDGLGHDRYRRHHCGYLVGLGYPPSWVGGSRVVGLRPGNDMPLREGMAFHVLSWLFGQDPADYVVSDTMLVTADGGEILTSAPVGPVCV